MSDALPAGYPRECERPARTRDGIDYLIRPIRPDDMEREFEFVRGLSHEARYNRLMYAVQEPSEELIRPLVNIDYRDHMALVATLEQDGHEHLLGVARYATEANGAQHEFAVVVTDAWQGRGIARTLLVDLFEYARQHGLKRLVGTVFPGNDRMLSLARGLGLRVGMSRADPSLITLSLSLDASSLEASADLRGPSEPSRR